MLAGGLKQNISVDQVVAQLERRLDQQHVALRTALVVGDRRGVRRAGKWVQPIRAALLTLQAGVELELLSSGAWVVRTPLSYHIVSRVFERDGLSQWFCCCSTRCWAVAVLAALEDLPEVLH